ncbi:benzoate/H(+) symporter BenE family transporter [Paenalcaligenes sp.]|uniref:benzoate/H(+) symporter BenE family transporter n=1 Tax=Paenalcaligenes sp. TaxID=1966342 RepID=UPI0026327B9D|nr:benzoate/H(+) symporter BenE family transporter [Paenalcaligenes sp.]
MSLRFLSFSTLGAGLLTVIISYSSSIAIVLQAAHAAGADSAQLHSWMWALGIGVGISTLLPSLLSKTPVVMAWSTPGAALLATSLGDYSYAEAIGFFLFASFLMTLVGLSRLFYHFSRWVPPHLAAAMLAGILVQFGMQLFNAAESNWVMVLLLLSTFFITRLFWPRLALVNALCVGVFYLLATQALHASALHWFPAIPVWQSPAWNLGGLLGVALPLFLVTLSAQNLPGVAMMQSYGYQPPISPLITTTGVVGLLLAPFGGFAFNLAAITAALCLNPDAHPDPKKRYHAAVWAGLFYLGCGLGGAALIQFFLAMPKPFIAAIAGLALIGTISQSFGQAFSEPAHRESALFAFLATASGISLFNIGSAFWGLLCGLIVHHLFRSANTPTQP